MNVHRGTTEYVLMCQTRYLGIEPQSRLGFLLSDLQLSILIFPDIRDLNLPTEVTEYFGLRLINDILKLRHLLLEINLGSMRLHWISGIVPKRLNTNLLEFRNKFLQLIVNVLEFLFNIVYSRSRCGLHRCQPINDVLRKQKFTLSSLAMVSDDSSRFISAVNPSSARVRGFVLLSSRICARRSSRVRLRSNFRPRSESYSTNGVGHYFGSLSPPTSSPSYVSFGHQ
jgi:hypothetical protein